MKRLLTPLITLLLLLSGVRPVWAHAELVRSLPEANASLERAPAEVELYFSEALEPAFSTIRVLDANGNPVDNADTELDPADPTRLTVSLRSLPDGVYTVAWQVLSAVDGHVTSGAFPFAVGDVDASALAAADQASRQIKLSTGEVLARWASYISAAMLAGGTVFVLLVWEPAIAAAGGGVSPRSLSALWRRLGAVALAGVLAAALLSLLVHAGQASGAEFAAPWNSAVGRVLFHTRYGALWLARLVATLAAGGLLLASRSRRELWGSFGAAVLLLLTVSLGSHAAAEPRPALPVLADWVHLVAASVWVGGLTHLAAGLWSMTTNRRRSDSQPALTLLLARLLPRFSALAIISVAMLSLTGTYLAVLRLGSMEALTGTLYGRTLLVKLLLALPMLALGAANLLWITPRVQLAARKGTASALVARFQRTVSSEVTLGAAVLLSVGVFTALPPARVASTAPALQRTTQAEDLHLALTVAPGRVGVNTFTLKATSGGQPVTGAKEVALRFTPMSGRLPPSEVILEEQQPGEYGAQGAYLSLPEAWQVQAVVRRENAFDVFANFDIDLAASGSPGSAFPWHRITGGLLLMAALLFVFVLGRLPTYARRPTAPRAAVPALALFAAGVAVFYLPPAGQSTSLVNPIPPNPQSIATGQALYEANCLPCHGPSGKGDGPVGLTLNPRPADLSLHAVPGVHTDGQLYEWITNGFPGSVMPAFKDVLTDDERWHLVNYVRTLAPQ